MCIRDRDTLFVTRELAFLALIGNRTRVQIERETAVFEHGDVYKRQVHERDVEP